MEFLVRITVQLPHAMDDAVRKELLDAEWARGAELQRAGVLKRIWRIPGKLANVSLYEAADATELHDVLMSLPLFPWFSAEVQALAVHPLEQTSG